MHEKDDQWTHTFYQLISDNQNGSANDHVLQLNSDGTVSCNGRLDDKNSKDFVIYFRFMLAVEHVIYSNKYTFHEYLCSLTF